MNIQNLLIIMAVLFNSINSISEAIINVNNFNQSEHIQMIDKYNTDLVYE